MAGLELKQMSLQKGFNIGDLVCYANRNIDNTSLFLVTKQSYFDSFYEDFITEVIIVRNDEFKVNSLVKMHGNVITLVESLCDAGNR
jgi:hypothetical protein